MPDSAPAAPPRNHESKTSSVLTYVILALCLLLGVAGFVAFKMLHHPTEAHIAIAKAPPGALVSIDGAAAQPADSGGSLTLTVSPGVHLLQVTKDGYYPYVENVQVAAGTTTIDNVTLQRQPLAPGTLVMQGNLPAFKVTVDNVPRGEFQNDNNSLKLEPGAHTIQFSNEDGSDSAPSHTVQIVAGTSVTDTFTLNPPPHPSTLSSLVVQTTPNASISVDHRVKGKADKSGRFVVNSLRPGPHTIDISLDKFQPVIGRKVIASGQQTSFLQPLVPTAPTTGSLSIETTPDARLALDGQISGVADASGSLSLTSLKPGTYSLEISKEGYQPVRRNLTILAGSPVRLIATLTKLPPPLPVLVDHAEDIRGIQAAVANFTAAFQSRNLSQLQAAWLDSGSQVRNLATVFQTAEIVKLSDKCMGQPEIRGDIATQRCNEMAQYSKDQPPTVSPFTYTFVKTSGGKWVLKDRTFLR